MSDRFDKFAYLKSAANHGTGDHGSKLGPAELGVLVAMWNYADSDTAEAYPSIRRLAGELGVDKSTVSRTLAKLCRKEWLRLKSAGSSQGAAAVYQLTIPGGCIGATLRGEGVALAQPASCTDASRGCTSANQQIINKPKNTRAPTTRRRHATAKLAALHEALEAGKISGLRGEYGYMFAPPDAPDGLSIEERRVFMDKAKREAISEWIAKEESKQ